VRQLKYSQIRKSRRLQRERRHRRVRNKVAGTPDRPRLVVHRSLKHLEGQLVDDVAGHTLLGASTRAPDVQGAEVDGEAGRTRKVELAFHAGRLLAERAREQGIEAVVFDRGGYKYHGRVKAFAEGAREGGLRF
jgi:large subunit ribosomal protein L18